LAGLLFPYPSARGYVIAIVTNVYDRKEGQTQDIGGHIADPAFHIGHSVDLFPVKRAERTALLTDADVVLVAGSIHMRHHSRRLLHFVSDHDHWLNSRPSAFLSVSMAASRDDEEGRDTVAEYLHEVKEVSDWKPDMLLAVAGALKFKDYGPLKRFIMKRIAREMGVGDLDPSQNYVYTDWEAVDHLCDALMHEAENNWHPPVHDMMVG